MDAKLAEIITRYNNEHTLNSPKSSLELELRFKNVTREAFSSLYNAVSNGTDASNFNTDFGAGVLECSVNVISKNVLDAKDDTQYIQKITFQHGQRATDTHMTKRRLGKVNHTGFIEYTIGLARETESEKVSMAPNSLLRFKIRVSFDYIGMGPARWRLDMTMVKTGTLDKVGKDLKGVRDSLFRPNLSVKSFLDTDPDLIDSYEIECEFIGDKPTVEDFNIAGKIFSLINPQYLADIAYQEEIYHCAKYIVDHGSLHLYKNPKYRLKRLSNQVNSLSKNTYYADLYPPIGYYLTIKTDGVRSMLSVRDGVCRAIRSDGMTEYQPTASAVSTTTTTTTSTTTSTTMSKPATDIMDTIVDGEFASDGKFYVFEVIMLNGKSVAESPFTFRMSLIEEATEVISRFMPTGLKEFQRITEDMGEFTAVWTAEYPYKFDGMLLIEPGSSYRNTKNYKWKPYEFNTIDFLVIKCPSTMLGKLPYEVKPGQTLMLLFVGIDEVKKDKLGIPIINDYRKLFDIPNEYLPIQFSPSMNPRAYLWYVTGELKDLDSVIVELGRNEDNSEWVFHRVRTDRKMEKGYYGNDFRVAEMTYLNYLDPFTVQDLWKPSSSYFKKTAGDIYVAANRYKRFVISMLMKANLSDAPWVIDMCAGRGGDLTRYREIGVRNALFIDIDSLALAELVRRKFEFPKKIGRGEYNDEFSAALTKHGKSLTVHTLVADMKTAAATLVAETYQFGINPGTITGIVCNFALHYMCDTIEHIRNILTFVAKMLKVGGVFLFTVMDGESVFKLLQDLPVGGQWSVMEDGVKKYAITRKFQSPKLTPAGQTISVLLPFSDEMYDEPLCNIDTVIKEGRKLNLELELNGSMIDFSGQFAKARSDMFNRLSQDDIDYITLHRYVSMRRIK